MKCSKCGFEIDEGMKFCPQCGAITKRFCPECGQELQDNVKYCPGCGTSVWNAGSQPAEHGYQNAKIGTSAPPEYGTMHDEYGKADVYENDLAERAGKEQKGNTIAFSIAGVLCLIILVNNWGHTEISEVIGECVCIVIFTLMIYFAIAAKMGFYGASKFLKKYRNLKQEIGKLEAIKLIEDQYDPNAGFALLKTTGIVGFIFTILGVIMLMAFC